jgi:leukotriene-A4 hydrolase
MSSQTLAYVAPTKTHRDPNTLSNYGNFVTTHIVANLNINFTDKSLSGDVELSLRPLDNAETDTILLDTR